MQHPIGRPVVSVIALSALLGAQIVLPIMSVQAQTSRSDNPGTAGPTIQEINPARSRVAGARGPLRASEPTGCGPGGDCDITTKPLDLSRPPTEKELRMAGQFGGALTPIGPADVSHWTEVFDKQLKEAGIPDGIRSTAPPDDPIGKIVKVKKDKIERLKKINLTFGEAMQDWNRHKYQKAAKMFEEHLKEFPDSPWAGEAALHLGCDAKYNGRFTEAQERFQQILENTSSEVGKPGYEIHQKAKLRWADLDIALGRLSDATDKLSDILESDPDWRRRTWARHWVRAVDTYKRNSRDLRACGTKALGFVFASLGNEKAAARMAVLKPPRDNGFSLRELSNLAQRQGIPMRGFRAQPAQLGALPTPFLIHYDFTPGKKALVKGDWRVAKIPASPFGTGTRKLQNQANAVFHPAQRAGHFLVVNSVDVAKKKVNLFDPQETRYYSIPFDVLEREWSGTGLSLLKNKGQRLASALSPAPSSASRNAAGQATRVALLSPAEMAEVVGGCCGVARKAEDMGPPTEPDCNSGSPVWEINPVNMNMTVKDSPLWYRTPVGPDVMLTMTYNLQDATSQNTVFGNKWVFNYGSYLVEDTAPGGGVVTIFMPNGRQDNYTPLGNGLYRNRADNFSTLTKYGATRFSLRLPDGQAYVYDLPLGSGSMQTFLVEMVDTEGQKLSFGYDDNARLTTITDAQGKVTRLEYDQVGHIERAIDPHGREASFAYDVNGNMVEVVDIEGNAFQYTYDADIRITQLNTAQGPWQFNHEGPDGSRDKIYYPAPGQGMYNNMRITITDPLNKKSEYYYEGMWGGAWFVDANNYREYTPALNNGSDSVAKTKWGFDQVVNDISKITNVTAPNGTTQKVSYDTTSGLPISFTGADNKTFTVTRNAKGSITSITDPKSQTTRIFYAPNGVDVISVSNAAGKQTFTAGYANQGQVVSWFVPAGGTGTVSGSVTGSYTSWGAPQSVTDSAGTSVFNYDPLSKQLLSVQRDGVSAGSFTYDAIGRVKTSTDPDGLTRTFDYDELDKVKKVTYSDGTTTETESICCGVPGMTKDRAGRRTYYDYDPLKRLTRVQDSQGNSVHYEYDAVGNRTRMIDPAGNSTTFAYDKLNRQVGKRYADGSYVSWAYKTNGKIAWRRDASGRFTNFTYDDNGNLTYIDYPTSPDVSILYNALNRPVQMRDATGTTVYDYDTRGRILSIDGPWASDTISYTYNAAGRRATSRIDGGSETTSTYDSKGRLDILTSPAGSFDYSYSGSTGRLGGITFPNGVMTTSHSYDSKGRLTGVQNSRSNGANVSRYGYDYDTLRNLRLYEDRQVGTGAMQRVNFTYDELDQLKSEVSTESPTPLVNTSFTLDSLYNRKGTETRNASGLTTSTASVNGLNQVTGLSTTRPDNTSSTTGYAHDARGNLVGVSSTSNQAMTSYAYDDADRLIRITQTDAAGVNQRKSEFTYDGLGRKRITREFTWVKVGGTWVWQAQSERRLLYDGVSVVQERDGSNEVQAFYTRGLGIVGNIGELLARSTSAGDFFYAYNGHGDVTQLIDTTGATVASYTYGAYGNPTASSGAQAAANPYRYSTKEVHVPTGLYDYGYRFYDPGAGRWLNRDPIGETGGLNLYGFAAGDPANLMDVDGQIVPVLLAAWAAAEIGMTIYDAIDTYNTMTDPCTGAEMKALAGTLFIAGLAGPGAGYNKAGKEVIEHADEVVDLLKKTGCFVKGTPVLMADGSFKPVEQIKVGDKVLSKNEKTGKVEAKAVEEAYVRQVDATIIVKLPSGETIETTTEHPFYVHGRGFIKAEQLTLATSIVTRAGPSVTPVTKPLLQAKFVGGRVLPTTVYNLNVADFHTYFVGRTGGGLWVHNANCPYNGDPFPGIDPRQGLHSPMKAPKTPYHNFPALDPKRTLLDPAQLPPGKTIEDVLRDAWNNPVPGGSVNPANGEFVGIPGYPLNSAGDTRMIVRVSDKGVHGWPKP